MAIFGLVFMLIGAAVVAFCVKTIVDASRRRSWQETVGVVTQSPVTTKQVGGFTVTTKGWSAAQPTITYEYEAGGRRHSGRGVAMIRETRRSFLGGRRSNMAEFAEGARIPVYYDPADPSRSATFRGGFGCAAIIGIVVGLFFVAFGWMFMRF